MKKQFNRHFFLKILLSFANVILATGALDAQAPTITSFTPTSGPVASVIIITGTNFSTTTANNIVWFGAVQGTVTAATATQLTVKVPVGANYQPISVTVGGNTAFSSAPFIVTFPSNKVIDSTAFATKVDLTTGTVPYTTVIGDIDGDGKPDLAVVNFTSNTLSVFRNISTSGTITAGSFAAKVDFPTGTGPYSIAIGDIDGDGKPDIAVANWTGNSVSLFRNTATSGSITTSSFAAKVDFVTGTTAAGVAIGDIDGDGKPDLVVTNEGSNTVSLFRNISTSGSITTSSLTAKVDFATGTAPIGVAIGDIDGDGKPDLAVLNYTNNTLSLFRNTSTSGSIGTGSLASRVDFVTGSNPFGIIIGDIDGDGKPDLAFTNSSSNTFSVYRNISTSGSITASSLVAKVDFTTGGLTGPQGLAIGDIDGDGKPDLAVANYSNSAGTVSVFRNKSSSGTISLAGKVDFATGNGAWGVNLCDLDGDGKLDLAITNTNSNTISILRNTTAAAVPPVITAFAPTSGQIGTLVTITGTNFNTSAANNIVWFGAVQATVTSASATQLTVKVPLGATYQPINVTNVITGLEGYSNAPFNVIFPSSQVIDATAFAAKVDFTSGTNPYYAALCDIDGDGKPDLCVANFNNNTISVFKNTSSSGNITTSSFAAKVDFITGTNPSIIAIGDVDGDGRPDLVVTNYNSNTVSVFRNTTTSGSISTSSFATKVDFTTGANPFGVFIGDIDGDGKPDLAVANNNSNTISIFRNTCTSGSITTSSFASKVDFTTGSYPSTLAIGDLDGDGKSDLAVTNNISNTVSIFRNTSSTGSITTGSFAAKVDLVTGTTPEVVVIGDVDGDSKPDLVVTNYASNSVSVFRNISTSGSIVVGSFAGKVDFTTGTYPYAVAIGDVDGDSRPDLVVANYNSNSISVLRNISNSGSITTGSFASRIDFPAGTGPYFLAIGDIDGDGKPDLAVANYGSSTLSVFRNTISGPPIISSFTPTSGPIGTSVTITGNNFSTTLATNIVWFGAVQATVTSATATQLTVNVPTGATYQPITVTVNGLTDYSSVPFSVTFPTTRVIDATAFATKVDFAAGTGSAYVALGDIDGDGKTDLVVANNSTNTVSVFRNISTSGTLTSGSFSAKVDFTTSSNPAYVALGDIDGDGKLDLVVANQGSSTVSIFRNTSTSGSITTSSFAAKVDFTSGTNPYGITIGDIDGDGKPDLAVANYNSSTVSVFRNTSTSGSITTGSFSPKVDFTTGTNPYGIALGDIDGDGKLDLAVTNYIGNTVSILRNTSVAGSITVGSFSSRVDFSTGTAPIGVSLADIDGDGKLDLIVANYSSTSISVFRNISTSGSITTGSFSTKVDFTTSSGPESLAIGDFDGDGKLDMAVPNGSSNTVSILHNTSTSGSITSGSFGSKVDFTTGTWPFGVAIGDLDGDGKPDIYVANINSNSISVFRNIISAPLPPTITSFAPTSGPIGSSVTITGTNFSTTAANNIVWFGAVQAAVTSATATQLTVTVPTGASYQPISVTVTGNTAYSKAPFNVTFQSSQVIDATAFAAKVDFTTGTGSLPEGVAIGDIDGDGKPDLVVANQTSNTVSVFRNTSTSGSITTGSFAAKVDFTTGTNPFSVTISDMDGDGKPDLVVANSNGNTVSVLRNTSTSGSITSGSFTAKVDFTTGSTPEFVAIGDIDGDGKPDMAVVNYSSNTVSVFRNISTPGLLNTSSFSAKVDFITGTNPYSVAIGDIDGDGKPDLLVSNWTSNSVSVFRNTSTSGSITTGSLAAKVDFTTGTAPRYIVLSDFDGDGKTDLAVTNTNSNSVSVLRNTATSGSITTSSFSAKVDFTTGATPLGIAIGDIDGDGRPDMAIIDQGSTTVSVLRNTSVSGAITTGSFGAKVDFATGTSPYGIAVGDLDGDGKPDLVCTNYGSNTVSVLQNTILIPAPPVITSFTPTSGAIGSTVTINGINFSATAANNIVWFGAVQATVTAATATQLTVTVPVGATYAPFSVTINGLTDYSSTPFNITFPSTQIIDATTFAAKVDFTTGTNTANVVICDIDGDGKPDLVVANNTSNTISVFRNTSTSGSIVAGSFATKVDFATGTGPFWVSVGDIDGDGKPDIVVANSGANSVSVFRNISTSGTITTGSFAAKVDFTTGSFPFFVTLGDIDGDGKPDLVVANNGSNSVSIFRNTSITGSLTTGSFSTKVDFTVGTSPNSIAVGDIDGDGKPDLAVTNFSSNTVSVFRNISTSGSITASSFASKVDFTTGINPYSSAIYDIDGDGKSDLVLTNQGSNSVSIFRNISTSGAITAGSFATKVDFTTGSGPIGLAFGDLDGDGKPDIAVPNNSGSNVSIFRNTSSSGSITTGSLAAKIDFAAGSGSWYAFIGDIDGDGKPDLAVTNYTSNTVSVFRNTITTPLPPVITSFTPASGAIGSTVTITGTGFSTTAANNIVWFGAVKATVTAATATQLTVTVPAGATYAPFTVTVNGLTDYSGSPFSVTFPGTSIIDATGLATKVDFTLGLYPSYGILEDIDGDGKPDIVATNWSDNTISVLRNTSTSGAITSGSFAAKVDFATGTEPYDIAVGDIDGDGKPDLVVTNYSGNTVSVFRNTSTSGSISAGSFATRIDFVTGTNPNYVAIGDIDGDGRPDLAVTNESDNTVSIFRNTSTSGSITASSFAAKVDFITGTLPEGVELGDIDGDGKPELIINNYTSNTVSILRNISTSGNITTGSFAAKVDFTTGTSPSYITIGDIDGDGKPDLAVTNYSDNTVSVLRNTSTSGSITPSSLAAKVDFTTGTEPTSVAINDINGDGKQDLAVTNYSDNTISVLRNISSSGSITLSSLATKVDFTTGTGPWHVIIGDIDGDGKPDLAVVNGDVSTLSVLRNTISLVLPPVITSFIPTSGPIGTTVTITGTNFSTTAANNIVWFGAVKATVTAATSTSLSVTVPTGTTYAPFTVTVNGLTDYSAIPFNVTFPSSQIIDATALATKVDFTTGSFPSGIVIGDIDGDGKPDLAVANNSSNTISIYRNISTSGSISASSFATKVDLTTGSYPTVVVLVDVDGDGKPDLVTANYNSASISVFRNTSTSGSITSGSFATKIDFTTGTNPQCIAAGDIDGDGKTDLAIVNTGSNTVSVFRNTGTSGSITASSFATKVDFTTGTNPYSVAVGDIDGDGKPELAVTNSGSSSFSLFRNLSTSGSITTGSFAAKVDFTTGTGPNGVVVGDIDGDGKADLIVANSTSNNISVFRNISTSGSITTSSLSAKVDFSAGTSPTNIAIGDIDGDGKPDIAVPNYSSNTVSVFRNTSSSGTINSSSLAAKVDFTTGTNPWGVIVGDIDGDGKPDLVVTNPGNNTVSVLRNTISGPPIISSFTPTSGPIGTVVTITGNNFSATAANNIVWFGAVKATVTAATTTQLTVNVPIGATYQPITVTVNGLTGYSSAPFYVTFPTSQVIDATALSTKVDFSPGTNPYSAALGDIDGDGKPDLIVANSGSNTVSVFRNTSTSGSVSTSSFATKVDFTTGTTPDGIAIGDIDGDGKLDIAVSNYGSSTISVFRNTATSGSITTSSLAAKVDFTTGTNPYVVAIGDIDGDGKPEMVATNSGSNSVSVFRNTSSSGSVTTSSFAAKTDFTTGTNPIGVAIGDIDGDGRPDLAIVNLSGNSVSVLRNTSSSGSITTGSFATKVDFSTGTSPRYVAIGDLDGDGKPEIIAANTGSNTVSVLRNTSTSGSITTGSFSAKVDFTSGTTPFGIALSDIDGDGKPDIIVANSGSTTISIFRNIASSGSITLSSFATKVDFTTGTNPQCIALGDIDGDGKPDIAVPNYNSSTVSVFRNAMATLLIPTITSFTPISGPIGSTVTITGTNFSTTAASNVVWFGAVKATVTAATATQLTVTVPTGVTYQPITVTVNGLTDYTNAPFNVTFPSSQIVDASAFATKVDFTSGTGPQFSALGDIDGDGKPDLVVANYSSNSISVYRNTSTSGSITSGSFATKVDFTTGTNPYYVTIGDIDGDGKPDLAIANYGGNTISVFRNTSTSGSITSSSLAARVDLVTGSTPNYIAIGDIDGDGKPELVVTNESSNTVSIFRNTGASGSITTGSFASKVDFITGTTPESVVLSDIDGDGKPDLNIINYSTNTVSVLRNTSSLGNITAGSFAAKVDFITGTNPADLIIADIDGDGKPDLAITNLSDNTVSILRNTSTSGSITTGSFASKVDFGTGSAPIGISVGDIDGDGKPDLAVADYGSSTISVFRNISSSGSITTGSLATKVDFTSGTNPWDVSIGDIDGDGKPDLAVSNYNGNSVSVLRNTIAIRMSISAFTPASGAIGSTVTITGTNFNTTAANNIVWFGATKATVTAATSTSLSVTVPTCANYQPITVTNVTTGLTAYSAAPFNVTFGSTQVIDATSIASKVDFTTGTTPYSSAIGDIDGDGKPDLVTVNYGSNTISIFRNTSTSGAISSGSFATKVDFAAGSSPVIVAIGDIDGDGKPDIVVANNSSNTVSVFRNTSTSGSITTSSLAAKVDFATGTSPYGVAIGDFDGDGKSDIAVANWGSATVSVFRNTSTSGSITTSSLAAKVDFTTGSNPVDIAIGDLDGDGKPDLAVANRSGNTVSVLRNTSTYGAITTGSFAAKVDFTTGALPYSVRIGDIDGDGKPDMAVTNYTSSTVSLFRNTSTSGSIVTGSFATKVDFTTGTSPYDVAIGDIDGDGKPDLAVVNYTSNNVSVFKNTSTSGTIGSGSLSARVDFTTGTNPFNIAIGDIDGDGKPDLVVTNYGGNSVSVLRNTVASIPAPTIGTITQPTCKVPTGSVALGGLPSSGTWTVTRSPGGTTTTGTGTSTTISGLSPGTYTFTVSNATGGTSAASASVIINAVPIGIVPTIKSKWSDVLICYNLKDSIATYQWYKAGIAISGATSQFYVSNKQAAAYKVQTTDLNGCTNFSNIVTITGTKSFSVYPNPAKENFAITLNDENIGKTVITVINGTGTKVMEIETDKQSDDFYQVIPIANLNEGVYYVKVTVNQVNVYYTKIVIVK